MAQIDSVVTPEAPSPCTCNGAICAPVLVSTVLEVTEPFFALLFIVVRYFTLVLMGLMGESDKTLQS